MCASMSACARTHSYSQFARLCVQHRAPHKEDIVRICAVCILFPSPYLTLTLTIKKYKAICSLYHLYAELRRSVSFPLSFTESQSWRVCSIHSALARSHTITHTKCSLQTVFFSVRRSIHAQYISRTGKLLDIHKYTIFSFTVQWSDEVIRRTLFFLLFHHLLLFRWLHKYNVFSSTRKANHELKSIHNGENAEFKWPNDRIGDDSCHWCM